MSREAQATANLRGLQLKLILNKGMWKVNTKYNKILKYEK